MTVGKGELLRDKNYKPIQVFTPSYMLDVTEDGEVVFNADDIAFRVPEEISYTLAGGTEVVLLAGSITGILTGVTYTFSAASTIEVM